MRVKLKISLVLIGILLVGMIKAQLIEIIQQPNVKYHDNSLKGNVQSHDFFVFDTISGIEVPGKNLKSETVIKRLGYTLSYNKGYKQANWVAYELTSEETNRSVKRTNSFRPDEELKGYVATNIDYKGSGWDRGHLAPAGDMSWSWDVMHESFYYSNISPQAPPFNRGIWLRLEDLVRKWANKYEKVLVVVGPVLTPDLTRLGIDSIAIPNYFYKVILDITPPELKGIAFCFPNEGSDSSLQQFVCTIDSVEQITGFNFFSSLPDTIEEKIESKINLDQWEWVFRAPVSANSNLVLSKNYKCKFIDSNGKQCLNSIDGVGQYCSIHKQEEKAKMDNLILVNPNK